MKQQLFTVNHAEVMHLLTSCGVLENDKKPDLLEKIVTNFPRTTTELIFKIFILSLSGKSSEFIARQVRLPGRSVRYYIYTCRRQLEFILGRKLTAQALMQIANDHHWLDRSISPEPTHEIASASELKAG